MVQNQFIDNLVQGKVLTGQDYKLCKQINQESQLDCKSVGALFKKASDSNVAKVVGK